MDCRRRNIIIFYVYLLMSKPDMNRYPKLRVTLTAQVEFGVTKKEKYKRQPVECDEIPVKYTYIKELT